MSEEFKISTDYEAEWAVKKIKSAKQEYERIKKIADDTIADTLNMLETHKKKCDNETAFLKHALEEYFNTVEHKVTKTQESYQLLSGKLVRKRGTTDWERDNDTLINFLKANAAEYVKVSETVDWAGFKKQITSINGKAYLNETGEEVPGITTSVKPDTFEVV